MANIVLNSSVKQDNYTDYISRAFDLHVSDVMSVTIPMHFSLDNLGKWNIGVICGASGTGKSQILKRLGGAERRL